MTARKPTPQSRENVSDDQDDDHIATPAGFAAVTSQPMELEIDVTPLACDGSVKVQLLGDAELPNRGISTTVFLAPDDARRLAAKLNSAAAYVEGEDE